MDDKLITIFLIVGTIFFIVRIIQTVQQCLQMDEIQEINLLLKKMETAQKDVEMLREESMKIAESKISALESQVKSLEEFNNEMKQFAKECFIKVEECDKKRQPYERPGATLL